MKTCLVLAVGLAVLIQASAAQAAFKGCYERVYDKAYLKKHRKQDVNKIRLQLGIGKGLDGPFELLDRVDAGFRKKPIYRGNLVICKADGNDLSCDIEGDGGRFTVTDRGDNSLRITNISHMRFGDGDTAITINARGEHREFRLYRISESACP
jgi:hypothetical protein